jgi:hypothetical protein
VWRGIHIPVVAPVHQPGQIEELSTVVNLGPEPMLELLFVLFENGRFVELVEVGEHAHHLGEPVHLKRGHQRILVASIPVLKLEFR